MSTSKLSAATLKALRNKLIAAKDEAERFSDFDDHQDLWDLVVSNLERVVKRKTIEALALSPLALLELKYAADDLLHYSTLRESKTNIDQIHDIRRDISAALQRTGQK